MNCASLLLLTGTLASVQPGPKRVAVFDLTVTHVKQSLARTADVVLRSLVKQREPGSEILAPGPAADCAIVECFVSMGKEMAAREIVAGRISSMGKTLILELQRIDVDQDRAVASTVRTVRNDEDALFGAIKDSLEELYRAEPPPAASAPAASTPAPEPAATGGPRSVPVTGFEDFGMAELLETYTDSQSRLRAEIVSTHVHDGYQALLFDADVHSHAGAIIPLSGKQADWTGMTTLKLWVYGKWTGRRFDVVLEDAEREQFSKNLRVDFTGWKQISIPLAEFVQRKDSRSPTSKPNGKIQYPLRNIQILAEHDHGGEGSLTLYFDDVEVTAE